MNAYRLLLPDGQPSRIWACGNCDTLTVLNGQSGQESAEACCRPRLCECGSEVERYRTACTPCIQRKEAEKEAQRMAAAEKLDTWGGWVYWDGQGPNDGYFTDLGELLEWHDDEGEDAPPLPEFVFVCKTVPFQGVDPEECYERCCEESYENAEDALDGKAEFEAACRAFNAANVGLVSYTPDFGRAVRVKPPSPFATVETYPCGCQGTPSQRCPYCCGP